MTAELIHGCCLERMGEIPAGSVDMVLADLPYGTTVCRWDSAIPFAPLWAHYKRVLKPNGAVVLTAAQPFTSALVMSNPGWFKYDWTWRKPKGTGHLNAARQPMRDKEDVLVFYARQPVYNPQFGAGGPFGNKRGANAETYGKHGALNYANDGRRYPKQVIEFGVVERGTLHPCQKPVDLLEYLIRTYTNPGDRVLDNAMGSGSTGIACVNTGRRFIGIELDPHYFAVASERIAAAQQQVTMIPELEAAD